MKIYNTKKKINFLKEKDIRKGLSTLGRIMTTYSNKFATSESSVVADEIVRSVEDSLGGMDVFKKLFVVDRKGTTPVYKLNTKGKDFAEGIRELISKPSKIENAYENTPSYTDYKKTIEKDLREGYGSYEDYKRESFSGRVSQAFMQDAIEREMISRANESISTDKDVDDAFDILSDSIEVASDPVLYDRIHHTGRTLTRFELQQIVAIAKGLDEPY